MEQKDYWQRHARTFAGLYEKPTWFNRVFRRALYLRTEMVLEEISQKPGATVLDVGCGPGRNSILFVKKGVASSVLGVDLSENMIAMARRLADRRLAQPELRCLGNLLPGHEPYSIMRTGRPAHAAAEAPRRIDVNFPQR